MWTAFDCPPVVQIVKTGGMPTISIYEHFRENCFKWYKREYNGFYAINAINKLAHEAPKEISQ